MAMFSKSFAHVRAISGASILMAATALTTWAVPALAQGSDSATADSGEILVTARKRAESLTAVPEAVTAFNAERIENAGIRSLQEFTQLTPNINISSGSGTAYPNIMVRGLAQAQGGEAPIAVVVDGVQISQPAFINRDYGDVAQVEVLRGPQGSLYGRNAIGGAINITTKLPTNDFTGRVKASYGNANAILLDGSVSGPMVADKVLFRVGASYTDSDGIIRNQVTGRRMLGGESYFLTGRLIFNLTDQLSLDLRGNYGHDDVIGPSAEVVPFASWDDFKPGFFFNDPPQGDTRTLWDVSAKLEYSGHYLTVSSITGYSRMKDHQTGDADFAPIHFFLQDVHLRVKAFTEELRLSSPSTDRFRWLLGAFYQHRDTDNFLDIPFDDGTGTPVPGSFLVQSHDVGTSKSWAAFGSASYDIVDNLELTLGARYDEDKRTSVDEIFPGSDVADKFTSFQPKVQLAYKPTPDLNFYATYGEGFGSGGFNAFIAGPAARLYKSQSSENYEVGFKGAFLGGALNFSASLFHVIYTNQQLFFITANPPSQNILNIDKNRVNGAELEMTAQPTRQLMLSAGLGLTDSKIKKFAPDPTAVGNRAPQSTKYTYNLSGQYTLPLSDGLDLRAYGSWRRMSSMYWDMASLLRTGPKDLVNMRLFLEGKRWSVGGWVKNLLNEQYPTLAAPFSNPPDGSLRTPSERRTYGVEVNFRF